MPLTRSLRVLAILTAVLVALSLAPAAVASPDASPSSVATPAAPERPAEPRDRRDAAGLSASPTERAQPVQPVETMAKNRDPRRPVPGAEDLEARLIAPCCWKQTLDIHGSPISEALRAELRDRLEAGETAQSIERSLVARYGSRILAVPAAVPLARIATWLGIAFGVAGLVALGVVSRWRRQGRQAEAKAAALEDSASAGTPSPTAEGERTDLDARLADELERTREEDED